MSLVDQIITPADVQALPVDQLPALAEEIRSRVLEVVGRRGGHLTSNLGVTELTIALHRVFDFSTDRLLLDVGHQCYPHKLLTGRNERFDSLRQAGGVSGFPDIAETGYDLFNVGHAGTAIATAVGIARGDQILERERRGGARVGDARNVKGVGFVGLKPAGKDDEYVRAHGPKLVNDVSTGPFSEGGQEHHRCYPDRHGQEHQKRPGGRV